MSETDRRRRRRPSRVFSAGPAPLSAASSESPHFLQQGRIKASTRALISAKSVRLEGGKVPAFSVGPASLRRIMEMQRHQNTEA